MRAQIGIRELRDTLTTTIRRVRNGETLEVTHDGVPVAILGPMPRDRLSDLLAAGDLSPPEVQLDLDQELFPVTGELSASEALQEDRSER